MTTSLAARPAVSAKTPIKAKAKAYQSVNPYDGKIRAYLPIDGEAGWKPALRPEIALNNRQSADAPARFSRHLGNSPPRSSKRRSGPPRAASRPGGRRLSPRAQSWSPGPPAWCSSTTPRGRPQIYRLGASRTPATAGSSPAWASRSLSTRSWFAPSRSMRRPERLPLSHPTRFRDAVDQRGFSCRQTTLPPRRQIAIESRP